MSIDTRFLKEIPLSTNEEKFVADSNTAVVSDMNQSRVASELYFAKTIDKCVEKQIHSNTELADSNEKYASRMVWLTIGLVVVAIAQAAISYYSIRESREITIREHTLVTVSELLQNLRETQEVYLNPQHYTSLSRWQEEMRRVNTNLNKSFGTSLLLLSDKEGKIFAEYSDLQVEYLRRVSVGRGLSIDPKLREEFSVNFFNKTSELARAVRERLSVNGLAGEPKV